MQKHQVNVIRLELPQAFVNALERLTLSIVGNPDLRHQKEFVTADPALFPCTAHSLLIMIGLGRIFHPVPDTDGIKYATFTFLRRYLIDAIAHLWHFNAIV